MRDERREGDDPGKPKRPCLSAILPDGRLVELLYDDAEGTTQFAAWDGREYRCVRIIPGHGNEDIVPYSGTNNLLKNGIVLFPSAVADYESTSALIAEIQSYLHRYVDLSGSFERLAAYYVLLSWVHDRFNELPYLRLRGDYGTGKTRFLLIVGSICYKPIFASGASTVSPLFHMLDRFGGTLIVDEADFRFSDEKADLVKILNNGNVRGFPVLRSESKDGREFNPRAFQVFGPKIIAMRNHFDDPALESRFITETTGERPLRRDIPINLPDLQRAEAQMLRNKLLLFRFRNFRSVNATPPLLDENLEPRLNQIYAPLAAVIDNEGARADLRESAQRNSGRLRAERAASIEAQVLTAIRSLMETGKGGKLTLRDIADLFIRTYGADYERQVSNRWLGHVMRRKLNLVTQKSHGIFVVAPSERRKLEALFDRYGVTAEDARTIADQSVTTKQRVDSVDLGDVRGVSAGR
jgi:hypothetical protein